MAYLRVMEHQVLSQRVGGDVVIAKDVGEEAEDVEAAQDVNNVLELKPDATMPEKSSCRIVGAPPLSKSDSGTNGRTDKSRNEELQATNAQPLGYHRRAEPDQPKM